ncbi:MAG: 30S ribosomal protein S20 [Dehalococcoidales bacterium]|nr:30S ribosomal protein S20 [Dehalococcoidales bacterium]
MPILESVKREFRAARRKQERNRSTRTLSKSTLKKAEKSIATGDADAAKKDTITAVSSLDKAATKRVLHRNNAARHKSRLMKKLNKVQAAAEPEAEKKTE